jgi:predicted acetyltransferase
VERQRLSTEDLILRPAQPGDRVFAERVYFDTQRWIIERLFGWRGDEIERAKFAEAYDESNARIMALNAVDVGWLAVSRTDESFELEGIYIANDHQRKGLGSEIVRQLIEKAEEAGVPVRLSTAKINPARLLYRRFGFVDVREDEFKVYMERPVGGGDGRRFQIRRPSHELIPSFVRMRDAFMAAGEDEWRHRGEEIAHTDPAAYVDLMTERSKGRDIAEGYVRADEFWILEDGEVVGGFNVRHTLTEELKKIGGHIGYHTHPAHRRRGIATFALQSALNVLQHLGVAEARIVCLNDNEASIALIEKFGAERIEDAVFREHPELTRRRYLIPLATR